MANQSIVVADGGVKFALNPNAKDIGTPVTLTDAQSAAVRAHVQQFCEAALLQGKELPYHDLLTAGKRVGMRGNNKMLAGIRSIIKNGAASKPDADLERAKEEIALRNAQRKAVQKAKREEKKQEFLQQVAGSQSIEDAMAEAEERNAKLDLIAKVQKSNLPKDAKAKVLALIG